METLFIIISFCEIFPYRSALGTTPGVSSTGTNSRTKFSLSPKVNEVTSLREELKVILACYRAKRAQITSLHEKLFATRCDLHKAIAQRDRAEVARSDLQVRR